MIILVIAVGYLFPCGGRSSGMISWALSLLKWSQPLNPESRPTFLRKTTVVSWELSGNACALTVLCYCWRLMLVFKHRLVIVKVYLCVTYLLSISQCSFGGRALSSGWIIRQEPAGSQTLQVNPWHIQGCRFWITFHLLESFSFFNMGSKSKHSKCDPSGYTFHPKRKQIKSFACVWNVSESLWDVGTLWPWNAQLWPLFSSSLWPSPSLSSSSLCPLPPLPWSISQFIFFVCSFLFYLSFPFVPFRTRTVARW